MAQSSTAAQKPATETRIGASERLAALALVREGRVFDLATELANDMPVGAKEAYGGFRLTQYRIPRCLIEPTYGGNDFSMDLVQGSPHVGSHIDALAHIQFRGLTFGGHRVPSVFGDFGWKANGVETVSPVLTRGILLDIPNALGLSQLPDGFEITVEHLERCLEAQHLDVRQGDAVLFRTGKMIDYSGDGSRYFSAGPGIGVTACLWLFERGMAILGSDTAGTEPYPFPDPTNTVHNALLVERGVLIVEILTLDELAASRMYEFLFVCLPLKFRGGTGSWVRPIAVI